MARFRFHCTNGYECVLDATGTDIRSSKRLPVRARQVAAQVMRNVQGADWSQWRVTVHDLKGRRVWMQPFTGSDATAQGLTA